MTLIDFEEDVEILRKSGDFSSREEFLEETFRAFLKEHPELRVKLAVEKYRSGSVTLNRAAEVARWMVDGSVPNKLGAITC
jgi:hypothetical protein